VADPDRRDVPPGYGPWQTVYGLFRRWQRNGTWRAILTALQGRVDAAGLITWDVSVDSTVARAHQHAAGARRRGDLQAEPPGGVQDEPADHGLGRSRGGLTTKVHLACEQGQKPLSVVITAGQRGDSPQFQVVLGRIRFPRPGPGRPRTRPGRVLADKAYGSRANRAYLRRRGIRCTIPDKADQIRHRKARGRRGGLPPAFDPEDYKARATVEMSTSPVTTAITTPRSRRIVMSSASPMASLLSQAATPAARANTIATGEADQGPHRAVLPAGLPSMPASGDNLADSRPGRSGRAVCVSLRDRAWRSSDRHVSRISPSGPWMRPCRPDLPRRGPAPRCRAPW
jgi:hypothetical protein